MLNTQIKKFSLLTIFLLLITSGSILYVKQKIDDKLLFGLMGSIISIFFAIINFQIEQDKMFNQLFTDLNRRYTDKQNDLINNLRIDYNKVPTQAEQNLIIDYFNLCSEEYLWFKKGRIPRLVWNSWRSGMLENLKIPAINEIFKKEISSEDGRNSFYGLPENLGY